MLESDETILDQSTTTAAGELPSSGCRVADGGAILGELVRRGYHVLVPFGTNQRFDVVLDMNGTFVRAQCKTGRLRNGVIRFPARSVRTNTRKTFFRGYSGEVEIFLIHYPETGQIYAVSVDEAPDGYGSLRVDPTRNGQEAGVRWARDYELPG